MKKILKKYIIALSLDPSKCYFSVKNWDGKSKVYFQDGGYSFSTFTTNIDKAKQYASIKNVKAALKAIRFFYDKQLLEEEKADIIEVLVTIEEDVCGVVEQCSF